MREDSGVTHETSPDLRLRAAAPADAAVLARLNRHVQQLHRAGLPEEFTDPDPAAVRAFFQERLQQPGHWAVLAEVGGLAVGYLLAELVRPPATPFGGPTEVLYVHHVAVAPGYRQIGIGRALVGRAEQYALESGLSGVRLDVWSFNQQAQDFLAALGYVGYNVRFFKDLDAEIDKITEIDAADVPDGSGADDTADDTADQDDAQVLAFPTSEGRQPLDLQRLDLDQLAECLADQSGDYGHSWLIDPGTGEFHLYTADGTLDGEDDVDLDELDLIGIDPVPSRVWYGDMVEFIERITDEQAVRRLSRAIQGRGAFRRFRSELHEEYPSLLPLWRAFSDNRGRCRAVEWLADEQLITSETAEAYYAAHPDPDLP